MICLDCKKKEGPTPGSKRCNACYTKYWYYKHPGLHAEQVREFNLGGNWKKVMERDKYTCQGCDKKASEIKLQVHHIDGKGSQLPLKERNNHIDNLLVVCTSCHGKLEIGKRGMNQQKGIKKLKPGQWSRKYKECIKCFSNESKHCSKGVCSKCISRERFKLLKEKDPQYWKKWPSSKTDSDPLVRKLLKELKVDILPTYEYKDLLNK